MKNIVFISLILIACGCAKKMQYATIGSNSLEEIKKIIESSYREGDSKGIIELIDKSEMPSEILKLSEQFLVMGSSNHTEVTTTLYPLGDYTPTMDLPGSYNGKELKYNVTPSHWVVLVARRPEPNPSNSEVEMIYPVYERNGLYYISGGTWK